MELSAVILCNLARFSPDMRTGQPGEIGGNHIISLRGVKGTWPPKSVPHHSALLCSAEHVFAIRARVVEGLSVTAFACILRASRSRHPSRRGGEW